MTPNVLGDSRGFGLEVDSPIPACGTCDIANEKDGTAIDVDGAEIRIAWSRPEPREPPPAIVKRHNLTHTSLIILGPHTASQIGAQMTSIGKAPQNTWN